MTEPIQAPVTPVPQDLCHSGRTAWAMLDLTSRCNQRCVYCHKSFDQGTDREREFDLPLDRLGPMLQLLWDRGVKTVGLSGTGETTFREGWEGVAEQLLGMGIHCTITTNFSKPLSEREAELLAQFASVQVSLDTTDPDLFRQIRRGGDLGRIRQNMARVREAGARLQVNAPQWRVAMTLNDKVVPSLEASVRDGLAWGFQVFTFASQAKNPALADLPNALNTYPLSWMAEPARGEAYATVARAGALVEAAGATLLCHEVLEQAPEAPDGEAYRLIGSPAPPPGRTRDCLDPWEDVLLGADGTVFPCCVAVHNLGNHLETPLDEILEGPAFRALRRDLLDGTLRGPCLHCSFRKETSVEALREKVSAFLEAPLERALPLPQEALESLFQTWAAEGRKVALAPAGNKARWLLRWSEGLRRCVQALVDRDPAKAGTQVQGVPVLPPVELETLAVDTLLVVTDRFEAEILRGLQPWARPGLQLVPFRALGPSGATHPDALESL